MLSIIDFIDCPGREQGISKVLTKLQRISYVRCGEFSTQSQLRLPTFQILVTFKPPLWSNELFHVVGVYSNFLTIFCSLGITPSKWC